MARPIEAARPHKVKGFWFLVRRVPGEFSAFDTRKLVRISTGIRIVDDPRGIRAAEIVSKLHAGLIQYWKDKRRGRDRDAEMRYQQACERSRSLGFNYVPAAEAASTLPVEEILRRFENLARRDVVDSTREVTAVLGGVPAPVITTDAMVDEFEQIVRASLIAKSDRQKKKWRKPRETALEVFVGLVGSRPISTLTRADALKLRSHWQDRVVAGQIEIGTANKCIGHIATMFRAINESKQLNLPSIFERIRIGGGRDGQRLAFAPVFVQDHILADGIFDDLNAEARRVIYLIAETGLRLSEAINLSRATIRLGARVPHICVLPEGRDIKTDQSRREIPLVGVALMALREQPDGFPRYRDRSDVLSALVNKALCVRGLRPEPGQSLYSLRHTFEDRLTAVGAPDKIIACLMGHKWSRPRYGVGPSLEHKREWLERIAFRPPSTV
jgi:integrase